jgi:hypothetical protein
MNDYTDNPHEPARDVPMEDYGGDNPQRQPAPTAESPALNAPPAPAADAAEDAVLENAPVADYGGNSRDTRPHPAE